MKEKVKEKIVTGGGIVLIGPLSSWPMKLFERWENKRKRNKMIPSLIQKTQANELLPQPTEGYPQRKICYDFISDEEKGIASALLAEAAKGGMLTKSYSGLLECNLKISDLAKTQDGYHRGFSLIDGKITEQGKFSQAGIPRAATPLVAFQVASFFCGMYYQHFITEQLNTLNSKIDELWAYLDADDKAEIQASFDYLYEQYNSKGPQEDFGNVGLNLQKMNKLRKKYRILINSIQINVKQSWTNNKNEIEKWVKEFHSSHLVKKMELAYWAEFLYFSYCILLIHMHLKKEGEESSKAKEILKRLDPNFYKHYAQKYHELKVVVTENIKALAKDATVFVTRAKELNEQVESLFRHVEMLFSQNQARLNPCIFYEYSNGEVIGKYLPLLNNEQA